PINQPTPGDNSETQGPQSPPETNQPVPETTVKGKGVVRQRPEGSPSRQPLASGGNNNIGDDDDDYHHDQATRFFTSRNSRGFPLTGDYNNDDDDDPFDQYPASYARKLEMEKLQIEMKKL